MIADRAGDAEAEIFDAHLALLDDDALLEPAPPRSTRAAAEPAWYHATEHVAAVYRALPDPLLAERATDVIDVGRRVLAALAGAGNDPPGGTSTTHTTSDTRTTSGAIGTSPSLSPPFFFFFFFFFFSPPPPPH